jgi:hypothetical protein
VKDKQKFTRSLTRTYSYMIGEEKLTKIVDKYGNYYVAALWVGWLTFL